ncbi:MAG TPA: amidohydrolase family protein [Candidatus Binatus sp.]|nr:amidohydrolase family protein [Candidatus Binatus sp.]
MQTTRQERRAHTTAHSSLLPNIATRGLKDGSHRQEPRITIRLGGFKPALIEAAARLQINVPHTYPPVGQYPSMFSFRIGLLSLLVCAWQPSAWAAGPQTLRYTISSNGKVVGNEIDTFLPDGHVVSTFEFNDRGRGPKVSVNYLLDANGFPLRVDETGNDYLKAPVDEHFEIKDGVAHWKSTSEDGHGPAGSFYISNAGAVAETAFLVQALQKAHGAPVDLFPAGEARLERLTDVTVEDHGQKMHVTDFAITGLSFEPQTIWLDDEQQVFGVPGTWFALLREGWEKTNDQLYALDLKLRDERFARLAKDLAKHPAHPVAIEHVRLFDSEQATMLEDQTVIVSGDRFTAVGPASSVHLPADAERIDGTGKTILPGLFDMHVHVQALDGILNIASGVTSARDMGNDIDQIQHLQDQWQNGTAIGPRLWKAGFIDGHGPFQAPTGLYADTQAEAEAAVNRYADLGYVQIKLYSSLNPAFVPGIAKLAHARGLRVSGHVPNGITASQFVEDGADEIQHINFIFLNFLASQVKDTRTPERFTAVGANAAKLDLQSKPVNDFIQLLLDHHTTVDVTLGTFESMFVGRPGQASPDLAPVLNRLPAQVQRGAYSGGLPVTAENDQLYKDSYRAMLAMTKRMYDAGVPILAGTDGTAGIMLHRELELEVQAGIPPARSLQIATLNAARLLKQDKELGSIASGKRADFVLVEGNPAQRISDIRRCRLVMKNGTLYSSADLYSAVGIQPAE